MAHKFPVCGKWKIKFTSNANDINEAYRLAMNCFRKCRFNCLSMESSMESILRKLRIRFIEQKINFILCA